MKRNDRKELEVIEISHTGKVVRAESPRTGAQKASTQGRTVVKKENIRRRDAEERRRRIRKKKRMARIRLLKRLTGIAAVVLIAIGIMKLVDFAFGLHWESDQGISGQNQSAFGWTGTSRQGIEQELKELLEKNEEAEEFVKGYEDREQYLSQPIDLNGDYKEGQVPLLMQWDKRWGYDDYGDSIVGLAGCGPTCLTMAYLYFTGDTSVNPRTMAQFADDNGYHTVEGTSWSLWTEGAGKLGLSGSELPLDENRMKSVLNNGGLIVCSMRPGDFTTTGHYILVRGYDENGFFVNDPNRKLNSEKQWSYETLKGQIKNLWALYE